MGGDNVRPFRIGYALSEKKAKSFLREELLEACERKGVEFIHIEKARRLTECGDQFDAILHKDNSPEWAEELQAYKQMHPECIIIDDPELIRPLHNRVSMLGCVDASLLEELRIEAPSSHLRVPRQFTVAKSQDICKTVEHSGMEFPFIAKPLIADGSAESHKMFLVLNDTGLVKLNLPVVIQEFINHGGVLFKVYVVGESAICTTRKSLPDCDQEQLEDPDGLYFFSQISNLQQRSPSLERRLKQEHLHVAEACADVDLDSARLPDDHFIQQLSQLLRQRLHLTLFNYDLMQDTKTGDYLIVDINYFPGFAKMPNYLEVLSNYFASLAKHLAD